MSGLQTAFLPLQQFCDALVAPEPPQMLPGGLQEVPLSQAYTPRLSTAQVTLYPPGRMASGEPPQHAAVLSQNSPVIRQPPSTAHTVAPLPGSLHSRVQQVELPLQGRPSCAQPPVPCWQRPGSVAPAPIDFEHMSVQQSSFA